MLCRFQLGWLHMGKTLSKAQLLPKDILQYISSWNVNRTIHLSTHTTKGCVSLSEKPTSITMKSVYSINNLHREIYFPHLVCTVSDTSVNYESRCNRYINLNSFFDNSGLITGIFFRGNGKSCQKVMKL